MKSQIKSAERVRQHGEVFTNPREVNAMLDLVKEQARDIDATFLEPACGDGNFLAEILHRKLTTVLQAAGDDWRMAEYLSVRAFASVYGIDIMPDNVSESRARLYDNFFAGFVNRYHRQPSDACRHCVEYVLSQNIQCGNTLTCRTADDKELMITEWSFEAGTVTVKRYLYRKLVETGCACDPEPGVQYAPLFFFAILPKKP